MSYPTLTSSSLFILISNPTSKFIGLCKACSPQRAGMVSTERAMARDIEIERDECWEACIACAGTREMATICRNVHCDRLFERHFVDKKLQDTTTRLNQLQLYSKSLQF